MNLDIRGMAETLLFLSKQAVHMRRFFANTRLVVLIFNEI